MSWAKTFFPAGMSGGWQGICSAKHQNRVAIVHTSLRLHSLQVQTVPESPTLDDRMTVVANALYLEVLRLAYNLVTAFQQTCVPEVWRHLTLSKLRYKLFWLPGELIRPQHRPTLRLAEIPENKTMMETILNAVHEQKPLSE